jgi:aspartyl-tRNA(Asn)/glutamyl-tRNA(Gln) amidotransferase subunit A
MVEEAVWWSLADQLDAISDGSLSAEELAQAYLARIDRLDGDLASFVAVNARSSELGREVDQTVRAGKKVSLLAGALIGAKDNYATKDLPTRAGTEVEDLAFPKDDSFAVGQLRAAGAGIIGKTRMHEFAWGNITPPTRNPWAADYVPGGSSGGSGAAVAAGLCSAALGSDTGGSVRIPAAACGTVGLKPTFGALGRTGIVPHSWSLDHPGPITRNVRDAALLMGALAGRDGCDPSSINVSSTAYVDACTRSLKGRSVGVIRNHFSEGVVPDVARRFDECLAFLKDSGVTVREFDIPSLEYGLAAIFAIELASASAYHDRAVQLGWTKGFQPDVQDLVDMGRFVTAVDYLHAEQIRSVMCTEFAEVLKTVDVIASPTCPITAWPAGQWYVDVNGEEEHVLAASWRFTYPFDLTGMPAISVPAGLDDKGLPIGLQFAGRPFREVDVLSFAAAYERAHDWSARRPPGFD